MLVEKDIKDIYVWVKVGIYHSESLGLISLSSDGTNWITLSDKNLGATSTDVSSTNSYGHYYQWGNNYGFTSTPTKTSTRVDASSYGPGNYYSSSNFITTSSNADWSTVRNDNLWGDTTNTNIARRGPCDEGFHVMSRNDLQTLQSLFHVITGNDITTSDLQTYFKFPFAGYLPYNSGNATNVGSVGYVWTSSSSTYASYVASYVYNFTNPTSSTIVNRRGTGYPIRAFANTGVVPDASREELI